MTKIKDYNMNGTIILGVDAGYGNYKTARCCFPTSVSRSDQPPIFTRNFLEYDGSYYTIGEGHKDFVAEKSMDDDNYILTLAAIAKELRARELSTAKIDKEPTIHIGATANALERKGIQTERGNINREIIKRNMMLEQAKAMLELAKQEVQNIQYARIRNAAVSVKNEVLEMIAKVRERKDRLDLPIVSGKHLRKISDRTAKPMQLAMQSADNAEKFIATRKIDSFESLAKYPEMRERLQNLLEQGEKIYS